MSIPRLTRAELALLGEAADVARRLDCYKLAWCSSELGEAEGWTLYGLTPIDSPSRSDGGYGRVERPDYTYHGPLTAEARAEALEAQAAALRGGSDD